MAKNLSPDVIEWIIKLNATQAQQEYHKLDKANRELKKSNDVARKAMVELEKQGKKNSQEWKNLKNSIAANNGAMSVNRAKMEEIARRMDTTSMTASQLQKRLKQLTKEFLNTSKATDPQRYKQLRDEIDKTRKALIEASGATRGLSGQLGILGKMKATVAGFFAGIGMTIMTQFVAGIKSAFNIIVDFERENSRLAAILGTSRSEIKDMTMAARELGATTSFTAAEVTKLQIELAKLGFEKEQILEMEAAVLNFAKAVDTDLASAASFAGAALRIFGKDAADTESVLASFAVATTKSALDFSQLQTALSIVGPVAASFGFTLEDTTALLGLLSNAGFDASSSATATRNIFLNMADASGKLAKALGGPVKNAEDLQKGLQALQEKGVDLATALELTDKRSVAAFNTFMAQSGNLVELRDSITGVNDEFNLMAETMADNVDGALKTLSSASQELLLRIGDGLEGSLKKLVNFLTTIVRGMQSAVTWIKENSRWIKTVITALITMKVTLMAVNTVQKLWISLVKLSGAELAGLTRTQKLHAVATGLMNKATQAANTSMKALKVTLMSMPWTAIITAITTIASAIFVWKSNEDELNESEQRTADLAEKHAKKRENLTQAIENEKKRLEDLHKIASDVHAAEEDRLKAIGALNKAIPEYEGYIDKETLALKANTKALDENIKLMEQKMRVAYFKDEYQAYKKEQIAADFEFSKALHNRRLWNETYGEFVDGKLIPKKKNLRVKETRNDWKEAEKWEADNVAMEKALRDATRAKYAADKALNDFVASMKEYDASVVDALLEPTEGVADVIDPTTDRDPVLPTKKDKNKKRENLIKKATASIEATHQQNLADIEAQKEDIAETEYAIKKAEELIRYCQELKAALDELDRTAGQKDAELSTKIQEKQAKVDQDMAKATQAINAARASDEAKNHADRLQAAEKFYGEQERVMKEAVRKQEISQEAADIYLKNEQREMHLWQQQELKEYYDKIEQADFLGAQKKRQLLEQLSDQLKNIQNQILTDTGIYSQKLRELLENPVGMDAVKRNFDTQSQQITASFSKLQEIYAAGSKEYQELEAEKNRRLLLLNYQYEQEVYKLQENVGLSWADEYDLELLRLKEMQAQGIISEEQYQKKRLEIGMTNAKKYFDFYSGLSSSMFQAIQDAEIAASDAKYDVLIRQAENNGEETAALEQEKENKKLEIQKKYADVNFAIKVGQIIADTAVAIMKAFADLGPIGGAIAAAMITATGAAQVVMANSERQKIKNLQPSTGSSTTSSNTAAATATRALTGYSDGGYTGDGGRYEVAGLVHKGEYVVPKPIMSNPRVVDAVGTIEAIRLNRMGRTAAFAEGGFTSSGGNSIATERGEGIAVSLMSEMHSLTGELKEALKNVRAYVVYQDIENAKKTLERSRAPFTK